MEKTSIEFLHLVVRILEVSGASTILLGGTISLITFIKKSIQTGLWSEQADNFRNKLAKAILLGLEFLVAADIIKTVTVKTDINNLIALAVVVLIRTFLSFSLDVEIEGKVPWRKHH